MALARETVFAFWVISTVACASAVIVTEDITETGKTADELTDILRRNEDVLNIRDVTLSGVSTQFGTFQGGMDSIGLESGVLLGTGHVTDIDHTNDGNLDSGAVNSVASTDGQLEAAHNGASSHDAASISFTFVPTGTKKISIKYVFGSEEYAYDGFTDYQDALAIFVNGENCALVSRDTNINVNTVNAAFNSDVFINNGDGSRAIELHGFTTVLECIAEVNPDVDNTMKVVVADGFEAGFDSAVFLAAKSLGIPPGFPCAAHPPKGKCLRTLDVGDFRVPTCLIDNCKAGYSLDEAGDECCDIHWVVGQRRCPLDDGKKMLLGETICCEPFDVQSPRPNGHKLCLA